MEEVIRYSLNKKFNEAKALLDQYDYRIVKQDGETFVGTDDFHPTRLNLTINNGVITDITTG